MSAQQTMISPATLEAVIKSFNLTPKEEAALEALTPSLSNPNPAHLRALQEAATTTANAGIQYLLLTKPRLVRLVVYNEHLDPRTIPPFLERIVGAESGSLHPIEIHAVRSLLAHEIVVSNVSLFRQVWDATMLLNGNRTSLMGLVASNFNHLYNALNFRSISTENDSNANAMSIETLLFILAYLNEHDGKYEADETMELMRMKALKAREGEIEAWVQKNMPDYVDVPLAWVLKAYDLYQETLS